MMIRSERFRSAVQESICFDYLEHKLDNKLIGIPSVP